MILKRVKQAAEREATESAPKTLAEWRQRHAVCEVNRCAPWVDHHCGIYRVWRCSCGQKFSEPMKQGGWVEK